MKKIIKYLKSDYRIVKRKTFLGLNSYYIIQERFCLFFWETLYANTTDNEPLKFYGIEYAEDKIRELKSKNKTKIIGYY